MNGEPIGRLERLLGTVLRLGALTSTALLACGLILQLSGIDRSLSGALTAAGLVVLMATPVLRVVVSVGEYAVERDWTFLALTASVLVILLGSLLVALH
jgi:uncharacterized membrane protein